MLGNKIAEARKAKGWTQQYLADRMGTTQQTIQRYETGTRDIKASTLRLLSETLNVTVAYLLDMTDTYAKLSESVEVPLYGAIAAGVPIDMLPIEAYYPIPAEVFAKWPEAFLLRVEGESMNRILPNGCYALVDPCARIDCDGQPYAIRVGSLEATIKRIQIIGNQYMLLPDSTDPSFQPLELTEDCEGNRTLTIIGRIVWHCLPYEWSY